LLAIVNELYFQRIRNDDVFVEGERRLQQKLVQLQDYAQQQQESDPPFLVSDFGTRRRYSFEWQKHVVQAFTQLHPKFFVAPAMCC
jgi:nicotinate phosphoribosyltransferase